MIREGQQGMFIMFNRPDTLISMIKCTDDHPDILLHFQSNYRLISLTLVNWH